MSYSRPQQPPQPQLALQQLQQQLALASQQLKQAQLGNNQQQIYSATQLVQATLRQLTAAQAAAAPTGQASRDRPLGDGDDQHRNAKRHKPTSRLLPTSFTPSLPSSLPLGQTDTKLAPSLAALDKLAAAYAELQEIERKVDWTVERKRVEVQEAAAASVGNGGKGRQLERNLRIHVTATLVDQPWQLSDDELLAAAADVPVSSGEGEVKKEQNGDVESGEEEKKKIDGEKTPKVPRVEIKITGEVLDDEVHTSPLSSYLHRLVVEFSTPSSHPISWTRPSPPSSSAPLPASFTSSHPTPSSSLSLKFSLYLAHPSGDRYALVPELAHILNLAESDRVGVLESLWAYARERGLVVSPEEGAANGPKGGIKTEGRLAKFFNNSPLVPFHLLPEYLNRCLAPAQPRGCDLKIDVSPSAPSTQHFAFTTPLCVPSPLSASLTAAAASLSSSSSSQSTDELTHLNDRIALNCLATSAHLRQLHLLQAFTRDPRGFLEHWVGSQAGDLKAILGSEAGGMGGREGAAWKEELRRLGGEEGEGAEWVEEAARVLGMRETEGKLAGLKQQAVLQQQQQQQQQGYGRR